MEEDLAAVVGGVTHGPAGSRSEQYRNMCTGKDARKQFDYMVQHMTPDKSEAPGFNPNETLTAGSSPMIGDPHWEYYGALAVLVGLALIVVARRRGRAKS